MSRPLVLPRLQRTAEDARTYAYTIHVRQMDKAGRPYINHVVLAHERLVEKLTLLPRDRWDEAQQVMWLHDVLEPDERPYGLVTTRDLANEGFHGNVVTAVAVYLTPPPGKIPYAERTQAIADSAPLHVLLVKLADIEDNADPARLALLDAKTQSRLLRKYEPAMEVLRAAIAGRRAT